MKNITKKICFCVGVQMNQLLPKIAELNYSISPVNTRIHKPYTEKKGRVYNSHVRVNKRKRG